MYHWIVIMIYKFVFMTSLMMASHAKKNPQNFELPYLHWYLSYSIDQIKMPEMIMAILLAYLTSSFTDAEKSINYKIAAFLKMLWLLINCIIAHDSYT